MDRCLSTTERRRSIMRPCARRPGAVPLDQVAARWQAAHGAVRTIAVHTIAVRTIAVQLTLALALALALASPAYAAGGDPMPWDGPLTALMSNLAGPTARVLVTIAVVGCGLMWAFTRNDEGLKKLGQIAFGGAIAMGAATLMASLGFAGAVV